MSLKDFLKKLDALLDLVFIKDISFKSDARSTFRSPEFEDKGFVCSLRFIDSII